ncbi:unnamed protein product [Amoebophrya sp. A120]|nr:unnamed protein product [Amoebophrya sp. A120]|eukprot:GSA120T00004925001.1
MDYLRSCPFGCARAREFSSKLSNRHPFILRSKTNFTFSLANPIQRSYDAPKNQCRPFSSVPKFNCYKVLKVSASASSADIKKAYIEEAKKHHPDTGGSAEQFKKVSEAYEALTKDRKGHDQVHEGTRSSSSSSAASGGGTYDTKSSSSTGGAQSRGSSSTKNPFDFNTGGFSSSSRPDFGFDFRSYDSRSAPGSSGSWYSDYGVHEAEGYENPFDNFDVYGAKGRWGRSGAAGRSTSASSSSTRDKKRRSSAPGSASTWGASPGYNGQSSSWGRGKRGSSWNYRNNFDETAFYDEDEYEAYEAFMQEKIARKAAKKAEKRRREQENMRKMYEDFGAAVNGENEDVYEEFEMYTRRPRGNKKPAGKVDKGKEEDAKTKKGPAEKSAKEPDSSQKFGRDKAEDGAERQNKESRGTTKESSNARKPKSEKVRSASPKEPAGDKKPASGSEKVAAAPSSSSARLDQPSLLRVSCSDFPRIAGVYLRLTRLAKKHWQVFEKLPDRIASDEGCAPRTGHEPCFFNRFVMPPSKIEKQSQNSESQGKTQKKNENLVSFFSTSLLQHQCGPRSQFVGTDEIAGSASSRSTVAERQLQYVQEIVNNESTDDHAGILFRLHHTASGKNLSFCSLGPSWVTGEIVRGAYRVTSKSEGNPTEVQLMIEDENACESASDPSQWSLPALDFFLRSRHLLTEDAKLSLRSDYEGMVSTFLATTRHKVYESSEAAGTGGNNTQNANSAADEEERCSSDFSSSTVEDDSYDGNKSSPEVDADDRETQEHEQTQFDPNAWQSDHNFCGSTHIPNIDEDDADTPRHRNFRGNGTAKSQTEDKTKSKAKKSSPTSWRRHESKLGKKQSHSQANKSSARAHSFVDHHAYSFFTIDPYTGSARKHRRNPMVVVPRVKGSNRTRDRRGNLNCKKRQRSRYDCYDW